MATNNVKEIPGFYRDPITGKYFRDPGESYNTHLEKLKKLKTETHTSNVVIPKMTNVVQYLNARQTKTVGGILDSKEYLKMKCYSKKSFETLSSKCLRPDINGIQSLSGDDNFICGIWTENISETYFLGILNMNNRSDSQFIPLHCYVVDLCTGLIDGSAVLLYNTLIGISGPALFLQAEIFVRDSRIPVNEITLSSPLCCSCSKNKMMYAFGCENNISLMSARHEISSMKVKGKIRSTSFDSIGNILFSGTHNGKLYLHDLRSKKMIMNYELSKDSIVHASFLNSDHVIVESVNDKLCIFDIRRRAVVTEFFQHKQRGIKKQYFSTADNMLCCPGDDNQIRVWHISGGNPIYVMEGPSDITKPIKGWLYSNGIKTYLQYFENGNMETFHII